MTMTRAISEFATGLESRPFWDAAAEGRLLLLQCRSCGDAHWYPRSACPFCRSDDTSWIEASGDATIYSYSLSGKAAEAFVVAYVVLAEGPTVLTNIVDCDPAGITIGQRLRLAFVEARNGTAVPMFRPVP